MTLTRFDYEVCVEAETQEQADKIIAARIGHDEDLSEDGVGDYTISVNMHSIGVHEFGMQEAD